MRHAINDESHLTFENVNDLLLRVRMRWHAAPGRQRSEHLIHRLAVCDCPAGNSGTNFNCRILSFHFRNLRRAFIASSDFLCPKFALVTCHWTLACRAEALREGGSLAESDYEDLYFLNHNYSVCDIDHGFLICAKSCHITGDCHRFDCGPTSNCDGSA